LYKINFYADKNGFEPVKAYLQDLATKTDKSSRIKFNKITDYIQALRLDGLKIGMPYLKHLEGAIWELRPIRDRILFAAWIDGGFVLLHYFMKDTQKTPRREIQKAKNLLADMLERSVENE